MNHWPWLAPVLDLPHYTGNPLVDSVAEHQAATESAYWQYLHICKNLSVAGFATCFLKRNPTKVFLIIYGVFLCVIIVALHASQRAS